MKLEVDWWDVERWFQGLKADDMVNKTNETKWVARAAFYAGAQQQLERIFPHLKEPVRESGHSVGAAKDRETCCWLGDC